MRGRGPAIFQPRQAERGIRVLFSGCGRFEERLRTYREDIETHVRRARLRQNLTSVRQCPMPVFLCDRYQGYHDFYAESERS